MQLLAPIVANIASGVGAAATAAGSAAGGLSLAGVLQGTATVLGIVSTLGAAQAEAQSQEMAAQDAQTEQALETLQGIERNFQTRRALVESVGALDAAYAASGIDLSAGTVVQARREAYREADFATASDTHLQTTRTGRLAQRAQTYRAMAKRSRRAGVVDGLLYGSTQLASMLERGRDEGGRR